MRLGLEAGAGGEDVAEVLRHAFVDPEELSVLGLVEVGLIEAGGTAIFSVPGVSELVGEEIGVGELALGAGIGALGDAVVGGLAMLEAFATGDVREGEEEVVLVVVVRAIHRGGFADEVGDFGEELGAEIGVFGAVGDDVDVVGRGDFGGREGIRGSMRRR